jgi:hypothetical protein
MGRDERFRKAMSDYPLRTPISKRVVNFSLIRLVALLYLSLSTFSPLEVRAFTPDREAALADYLRRQLGWGMRLADLAIKRVPLALASTNRVEFKATFVADEHHYRLAATDEVAAIAGDYYGYRSPFTRRFEEIAPKMNELIRRVGYPGHDRNIGWQVKSVSGDVQDKRLSVESSIREWDERFVYLLKAFPKGTVAVFYGTLAEERIVDVARFRELRIIQRPSIKSRGMTVLEYAKRHPSRSVVVLDDPPDHQRISERKAMIQEACEKLDRILEEAMRKLRPILGSTDAKARSTAT